MTTRWKRITMRGTAVFVLLLAAACAKPAGDRADGSRSPGSTPSTGMAQDSTPVPDSALTEAGAALKGSVVPLATPKGEVRSYQVQPSGPGPFPGVVLVQEWWGLNHQIETVADRLAALGYAVIVPDLYHGHVANDAEKAHELSRGLTDESALNDLGAAVTNLRNSPTVGGRPVGIMGFCMGGRLSLLTALSGPPLNACVVFYGPPITDAALLQKLPCPLLASFGAEDEGIPPEAVKGFEEALKKAGKSVDIKIYENAGHAFMNDTRPSYRPEAAKDAWERVENFLAANLKS
jgi:carboxymethylenebutenolidase